MKAFRSRAREPALSNLAPSWKWHVRSKPEEHSADNCGAVSKDEARAGPTRSQNWTSSRLDRDCKTPSRLACRALEGADFTTRLSRLDASPPAFILGLRIDPSRSSSLWPRRHLSRDEARHL